MATITTDTYLDSAARTAGETWNITGCKLTIRTDTRWHANSPASMTGSLGAIALQQGGQFYVDGTKVRWIPYTSGSGTVPAVGTTITQGSVSGYLLGIWADYTSAPTAVGAQVPASGYIKFREVTGGSFTAAEFTSGISAIATAADSPGWIEVVMRTTTAIQYNIAGLPTTMIGDWFQLGTTTGVAGQVIQVPTNGGGANTLAGGVQIETSPGSGVYEWWGSVVSSGFTTAAIATDQYRGKVLRNNGSGQLIIGLTSTSTNAGYVPAAGCKIRIPNIFLRTCVSGTDATNSSPSTTASSRPQLGGGYGTQGANIYLRNVHCDWNIDMRTGTKFDIADSILDSYFSSEVMVKETSIVDNVLVSSLVDSTSMTFNALAPNTEFKNSNFTLRFGAITLNYCDSQRISNIDLKCINSSGSSGGITMTKSDSSIMSDIRMLGSTLSLTALTNSTISNVDYISCSAGTTTSSRTGNYIFQLTACGNVTIKDVTTGSNGATYPSFPYKYIMSSNYTVGPVTIKNWGTRAAPLIMDSTASSNTPGYFLYLLGPKAQLIFKRINLSHIRTNIFTGADNSKNGIIFENCKFSSTSGYAIGATTDFVYKGIYSDLSNNTGAEGTPSFDTFVTAGNSGSSTYIFMKSSSSYASTNYLYSSGIYTAYYHSTQGAYLTAVGDYAIVEQNYFAKGHTGLANSSITFAGGNQANMSFQYQIDTGSGWNGTWKTCNGTNFSAETIDPAIGFKIKLKVTCTSANANNYVTTVKITTTATATSIDNNMYALSTATLGFTGLQTGSEVRVYAGTDPATSVEIGGIESTSGSTFSFSHSYGDTAGYIMIFALGYQPIYIPYTFKSVDDSILIQQVIDRNYTNPA